MSDQVGQLSMADNSVAGEDRGYSYDKGWNLAYLTNSGSLSAFRCDGRNQLTLLNSVPIFTYDANGNLLTNAGVIYIYDDENRLVTVAAPGASSGGGDLDIVSGSPAPDLPAPPPSTGGWRTDFVYDGFGRLRVRQDAYSYTNGWYATNTTEYLYDGSRVIQERDGDNNPTVSYTMGRDLSGTLEGAGGIGGLLARSHGYSGGNWSSHNFYHADGGGNITCMINGSQSVVASYRYDPFGNLVSSSGTLAGENLRRFSSKEFHANSGMYIYLYRFCDPRLQRWINRDPVGEIEGPNLYAFEDNSPSNVTDPLGLSAKDVQAIMKKARDSIDQMTKNRERISPWLNDAAKYPTKLLGWKLKGCGQQADTVLGALLQGSYEDNWALSQVYVLHPSLIPTHQFLILKSENPADPVLLIDPYENEIKQITPGQKYKGIILSADTYKKNFGPYGLTYIQKCFY